MMGSPSVIFTARSNPMSFNAMCPWSWYIATTPSNSPPTARVGRKRSRRIHSGPATQFDSRGDDAGFLITEESVFASVRIERADGNAWNVAAQAFQKFMHQPDFFCDFLCRQQIGNASDRRVERRVNDTQPVWRSNRVVRSEIQHHAEFFDSADLSQNLGMSRIVEPREAESLLVERCRRDRINLAVERGAGGSDQTIVGGLTGLRVEVADLEIVDGARADVNTVQVGLVRGVEARRRGHFADRQVQIQSFPGQNPHMAESHQPTAVTQITVGGRTDEHFRTDASRIAHR